MIDLMKISDVQVNRRTTGSYVNGYYVEGALTQTDIKGNIQPLSGKELLQLPESDRIREQNWLFSPDFEIKVNDIIVWKSIKYEVQMVEDWSDFCLAHYRARITKLDNQGEPL